MSKDYFEDFLQYCEPKEQERASELLEMLKATHRQRDVVLKNESRSCETVNQQELPREFQAFARELSSKWAFRNSFKKRDVDFRYVSTDRLICLQNKVFLDYAQNLKKNLPNPLTDDALGPFCLSSTPPERADIETTKIGENKYVFTSDSRDLRMGH